MYEALCSRTGQDVMWGRNLCELNVLCNSVWWLCCAECNHVTEYEWDFPLCLCAATIPFLLIIVSGNMIATKQRCIHNICNKLQVVCGRSEHRKDTMEKVSACNVLCGFCKEWGLTLQGVVCHSLGSLSFNLPRHFPAAILTAWKST